MKKIHIYLITLTFLVLGCFNKTATVNVNSSLYLRELPNLEAKKLASLKKGDEVIILFEDKKIHTYNGIESNFVFVSYKKNDGNVISGYVFKYFLIEKTSIASKIIFVIFIIITSVSIFYYRSKLLSIAKQFKNLFDKSKTISSETISKINFSKLIRITSISITMFALVFLISVFIFGNLKQFKILLADKNEKLAFRYTIIIQQISKKNSFYGEDSSSYLATLDTRDASDPSLAKAIISANSLYDNLTKYKNLESTVQDDLLVTAIKVLLFGYSDMEKYENHLSTINDLNKSIESFNSANQIISSKYNEILSIIPGLTETELEYYIKNNSLKFYSINELL